MVGVRAGESGRDHDHQRGALRHVLVEGEDQDHGGHQHHAAADAEQTRKEARCQADRQELEGVGKLRHYFTSMMMATVSRKTPKIRDSHSAVSRCMRRAPTCTPTRLPTASRMAAGRSRLSAAPKITAPMMAIGTIAASDVACARCWSKARVSTIAGTMTVPPPTPNSPLRRPAPMPMIASGMMAWRWITAAV